MSLTYDGIIHRSLEEQVRYDAEQVQLLKQADVTINENLHTVNTEIDGKLTKPANPTAESAVTMLADGTVGTKPLSEIGGGGGKIYQHYIELNHSVYGKSFIWFKSSRATSYTFSELVNYIKTFKSGTFVALFKLGQSSATQSDYIYNSYINAYNTEISCWYASEYGSNMLSNKNATEIISDTVTEV